MVVVPVTRPVTTPADPTLAKEGKLLPHAPPPESVSVMEAPAQTAEGPIIEPGRAFTVTGNER